jgi:hypothetical protein
LRGAHRAVRATIHHGSSHFSGGLGLPVVRDDLKDELRPHRALLSSVGVARILADVSVPPNDVIATAANALPAVHSVLTIVGGVVVLDDGTLEHAGSKTLHKP